MFWVKKITHRELREIDPLNCTVLKSFVRRRGRKRRLEGMLVVSDCFSVSNFTFLSRRQRGGYGCSCRTP